MTMPMIEKNKNHIMEITGMTHEGQGVGRIEGLAVFVDGALEGEQVEVRIIKLNKTYAVGKLLAILKPSPGRAEPYCSAYRRCGGCNLQHMNYKAQLAFKTKLVQDNLERIGGLKGLEVHDTIGMQTPMNYRNKAQYPVASVNGRVVTGFYAARSHDVIDSEECGIQDVESDKVRKIVRQFIEEKGIPAYDETTGTGLVRHIVTRVGFNTGEIMVILVVNGNSLPASEELVRRLTVSNENKGNAYESADEFVGTVNDAGRTVGIVGDTGKPVDSMNDAGKSMDEIDNASISVDVVGDAGQPADAVKDTGKSGRTVETCIKSIYLNINTENTNVILGRRNILLYGSETITDIIGGYRFKLSPHSFFQVNPVQTEVLYSKALEYAGLTGNETVFDLYCGIGTISLFLASKARKVYGVEIVDAAIEDARRNAEANGIANAEFLVGEAEKVVPELYKQGVRADVVVLDPPRKGCEESLLQLLTEMQPERIVYVSCNPATLARDLKYMSAHGYGVMEAQPVDMFPWTGHVECVVEIRRKDCL